MKLKWASLISLIAIISLFQISMVFFGYVIISVAFTSAISWLLNVIAVAVSGTTAIVLLFVGVDWLEMKWNRDWGYRVHNFLNRDIKLR